MFDREQFDRDFEIPEELTGKARWIAQAIQRLARKHELSSYGCTTFNAPEDWPGSGGQGSLLVIWHEGSELAPWFDACHPHYKEMLELLQGFDTWAEGINSAVSAVYY